jgi:hypothetical protein
MKAMDPEALFVFLAAAIGHYPVESAQPDRTLAPAGHHRREQFPGAVRQRLAAAVALERPGGAARVHRRLIYEELARASDGRLADAVFAWRDSVYAGIVVRVGEALEQRRDAPEQWRRYAEQVLSVNRDAHCARSLAPEYLLHLRATLRQAADAAAVWPLLWRHCAERG